MRIKTSLDLNGVRDGITSSAALLDVSNDIHSILFIYLIFNYLFNKIILI